MGNYVSHLVRCLSERISNDHLLLYPGSWTRSGLGGLQLLGRALRRIKGSLSGAGGPGEETIAASSSAFGRDWVHSWGRRLQNWHYQAFAAHSDFDLYHEPNYIPFPCDKPTIITIADLSAFLHPHWHPAERAQHFARNFIRGLEQSAHVLTISEFSRREILKHLPVPPERVSCTSMGVRTGLKPLPPDEVLPVLQRLGLSENYLLHVGTLEPRKNLLMLLRSYTELPSWVREKSPLVLVGDWGWNSLDLAEFYHNRAKHMGVVHLGYAAEDDLPALYCGARALVFPSHYEGFGLPPLEMMACGGAVLGSTAGAVVEVVGARAHLLDPSDQDAWREAMQRVIVDDDWREELRRGVCEVARPFTWERCAEATYDVYCQVAGGSQRLTSSGADKSLKIAQRGSEVRP
jgi:alpha-1,3-rhamnosyl/mannosyltransferase